MIMFIAAIFVLVILSAFGWFCLALLLGGIGLVRKGNQIDAQKKFIKSNLTKFNRDMLK